MSVATPRATFRDPAGSLQLEEDRAVRTIHESSRGAVHAFLESAFCKRMQERGDMIGALVDDGPGGLTLTHPRVPVPTYPWEWTQSQWLAAAELTLRLGAEALGDGWILKDATPHNILFLGSRPVLVDILSFERREPGDAVWLAYGQYVRTFLLPLLMNKMLSWPLSLTLFKRDGYEPVELYRALGWGQRLSRAALWPISLPTWMDRRLENKPGVGAAVAKPAPKDPELALHILRKSLSDLRMRTRKAVGTEAASEWSEYAGALTHYTAEQVAAKNAWLSEVLEELRPARVLDVGANTGEYSVLAATKGAEVVALERDEAAAERLYRMSVAKAKDGLVIQAIHADLARPTPAVGWENDESSALLARLDGRFDLVMMLAVIHHLLLLEQIPLDAIVALCVRLTTRWLVIEWVPATDAMYKSLMRGRDELYGGITEYHLLDACEGRFKMVKRLTLENGRILLLFEAVR
jgi:SAM-dependent methyltransferase